jgi:hypothetical protein
MPALFEMSCHGSGDWNGMAMRNGQDPLLAAAVVAAASWRIVPLKRVDPWTRNR